MPNVSGLLADGDVADLAAEALPGAVWPSFCTGSRPPDHGVCQGRARGPRHIAEVGAYAAALT
jgi:hypothetical protein